MRKAIDYRVDLALIHSLCAPDAYLKKNQSKSCWQEKNIQNLVAWRKFFLILWVLIRASSPRAGWAGVHHLQAPGFSTRGPQGLGRFHLVTGRANPHQWPVFKSLVVLCLLKSHWQVTRPRVDSRGGETFFASWWKSCKVKVVKQFLK